MINDRYYLFNTTTITEFIPAEGEQPDEFECESDNLGYAFGAILSNMMEEEWN